MQNLILAKNLLAVAKLIATGASDVDGAMFRTLQDVLKKLDAMQKAYSTDPRQDPDRLEQLNSLIPALEALSKSFEAAMKKKSSSVEIESL